MAARSSESRTLSLDEIVTNLESENDTDGSDCGIEDDEDYVGGFSSANSGSDSEQEEPATKRPRVRPNNVNNRSALVFDWNESDFTPTLFPFDEVNSGISPASGITSEFQEADFFKLIFDDRMMDLIVTETNEFFVYLSGIRPPTEKSKLHKWIPTNTREMYVFLATTLLMPLQKKQTIEDYWSTDPLIATPMYGKIMSADRFQLLLRVLHFCDNTKQVPGDKLFKIRKVVELLKTSFSKVFIPHQNVVIDESLMLWKGRLSFKQYIPSKRHRFGVKLFVLCDCKTGYIVDFVVYTGASTEHNPVQENPNMGISGAIVMGLMEPYLNKGRTLFTDNWYTSPTLAQKLFEHKTGTCGTVKPNRKGMPHFPNKMKKGDLVEKHSNEILSLKWHDRRDVHMLSSVDNAGQTASGKKDYRTGEDIMKPKCVVNYNQNMGGIDKSDMQISFVDCARKSTKWYKKFFFHLLDMAVLNSYILYQTSKKKKVNFGKYRLELIRQLLQESHQPRKRVKGGRSLTGGNPLRLTERNFPTFIPATEMKNNPTGRCHVSSHTNQQARKRRESRYECKPCEVYLCVDPCFTIFHTLVKY